MANYCIRARLLVCASLAAVGALLLNLAGSACAQPAELSGPGVMSIPAGARLPMARKVALGLSKSLLLQFPFALKDVLVSDPDKVDAVLQRSDRVFLIARKSGQVNAFFFDANGQQALTLEVTVGADLAAVEDLLRRLIPGSNIKVETAGAAIVLTGSVRNPADSNRAADLAAEFASADPSFVGSTYAGSAGVEGSANNGTGGAGQSTYISVGKPGRDEKRRVINLLAVEGDEQVMLRVTVAEVQRSLLKQLGINVGAVVNSGNFVTGLLTENALPLTAARGLGKLPLPGIPTEGANASPLALFNTFPADSPTKPFGNSGVHGIWSSGPNAVMGAVRALERDGLIKTLAEPNLTAVSGETAKFLAGGEFPIPVVDAQGAMTVIFKEFGVGLAFTPVVLSEQRISLKIETEVSELTDQGAVTLSNISIPALKKRQARSTVELPSGGSLALAGLLRNEVRQNIDGLPGLKDLPVLGTLFRSRDFIREETELVVIVTPYTVRPVARQQLARPDDSLLPAGDLKGNFLAHLNRMYGRGGALPEGGLKGDYGFIVD